MTPALALAPNPTRRWSGWNASPRRSGTVHGPADALAADPAAARRLAHVAAASAFATDLLVASPERLTALADGGRAGGRPGLARSRPWLGTRRASCSRGRPAPRSPTSPTGSSATRSRPRSRDLPFAVIGMGKLGARELNVAIGPGSAVRLRGRGIRRHATGGRHGRARDARGARRGLGPRRRPPAGGTQRPVGALARRLPRVLGALRRARGSSSRCCAPGTWPATPSSAGGSC